MTYPRNFMSTIICTLGPHQDYAICGCLHRTGMLELITE